LNTRGFTLVELLVGTLVMSILGVALVQMLISDSRFVSRQDAMVSARQTARAAINSMMVDLRMTGDGGLLAAAPDSVRVRVPYALGITCGEVGPRTIGALLPPDSLAYAAAVAEGVAWLQPTGDYLTVPGIAVTPSSDTTACTADSVRVVPGGMLIRMAGFTVADQPPPGRVFNLYHTLTYRFAPSTEVPGRIALWRQAGAAAAEELAAPFDSAAGFAFLVGTGFTLQASPPADLDDVRGLELRLIGASEQAPQGKMEPETFELVTRVPFLNKDR
jgi:prepilin-type N-terminal cleavage/methylation domain-containing protein